MKPGQHTFFGALMGIFIGVVVLGAVAVQAQSNSAERSFPQSKAAIEKALKNLQGEMAGRLPTLDGFAKPGERPLDRYQRGYYQSAVEVKANSSGGCTVRITTKVTAWYHDPSASSSNSSNSGYELLPSNGRLESDLLEQLAEQLAKSSPAGGSEPAAATSARTEPVKQPATAAEPAISAPVANADRTFSAPVRPSLPERTSPEKMSEVASESSLQAQADSLREVLKNTAHPKNLVAVKKSGTPVVSTPSLTAKAQFLASMHDEFELLDFNPDWVHVRISGLSRGWIWRNSVEMPDGFSDTNTASAPGLAPAADLYHVVREESAAFPGDWEPLRGKNVKILSVQKLDEAGKAGGLKERLEYTKFLLDKNYKEISQKSPDVQGVVVIFDSADGGMIAATNAVLQQWVAGKLSDAALWHNCFFDPPESLDSSGGSGSK